MHRRAELNDHIVKAGSYSEHTWASIIGLTRPGLILFSALPEDTTVLLICGSFTAPQLLLVVGFFFPPLAHFSHKQHTESLSECMTLAVST